MTCKADNNGKFLILKPVISEWKARIKYFSSCLQALKKCPCYFTQTRFLHISYKTKDNKKENP